MRVTIAPYNEFPKAVFVDGVLVPSQTLDSPIKILGIIICDVIVDNRLLHPFPKDSYKDVLLFYFTYKQENGLKLAKLFFKPC
jgi:hypothetical protein